MELLMVVRKVWSWVVWTVHLKVVEWAMLKAVLSVALRD